MAEGTTDSCYCGMALLSKIINMIVFPFDSGIRGSQVLQEK